MDSADISIERVATDAQFLSEVAAEQAAGQEDQALFESIINAVKQALYVLYSGPSAVFLFSVGCIECAVNISANCDQIVLSCCFFAHAPCRFHADSQDDEQLASLFTASAGPISPVFCP